MAVAKVYVELGLIDKMSKGLIGAKASLESFGASARKVGKDLTMKMTLPIVAAGVFAVKAASDVAEAQGAVDTVYGDSAKAITAWSKSSATALGISREQALSASVTFAGLGKSAGLAGQDLVDFSTGLIGAASDLGSFYNVDPGQVLQDLRSGLAGEAEPLRKYNIFLNEATVAQKAMAMTGKLNADQLTEGDKIAARSALIMEGLGDAQGDFARTSDGLANSLRIAKAQLIDTAAILGTILLPYVTKAAHHFSELALRFQKLSPRMQKFILIALGIVAAIGPAVYIIGVLATALSLLLSPITLVIVALALLYLAYRKNFLGLGKATDRFIKQFMVAVKQIAKGFQLIKKAFDAGGLKGALDELFGQGGEIIMKGLGRMLGAVPRFIGDFMRGLTTGFAPLDRLLHDIGKIFTDVGLLIQNIFAGEWGKAFEFAKKLFLDYIDQYVAIGQLLISAFNAIPWGAIWDGLKAALADGLAAFIAIDWGQVASFVWNGIVAGFQAIPWGDIALYILDLSAVLFDKGKELLQGLRNGVEEVWGRFTDWLGGRADAVLGAIGDLTQTLLQKGKDLLSGLLDGATSVFGTGSGETITGWVKAIPKRIVEYIGDLSETLLAKGKSLISGFRTGMTTKWDDVTSWLSERAGSILAWLDRLDSSLLYDVGYAVVQGMANGLYAGAGLITAAVDYLVSLIPGPIRSLLKMGSPSKLMKALMFNVPLGMVEGMMDGQSLVAGAAKNLAMAAIPSTSSVSYAGMSAMSGGMNSWDRGGTTVYGGIQITVDGSKDPDATADAVFAKFNRELNLHTGAA